MSTGIDYGMGKTNIDTKTGIRYGVISIHDVTQAWADSAEPDYPCRDCEFKDNAGECNDPDRCCEPSGWYIDDDEYKAIDCLDSDIMVLKAPFYTHGRFCSPCVPGAVNLNDWDLDGEKAYCFGHDWFDDGKAPYHVYSVETGKRIDP